MRTKLVFILSLLCFQILYSQDAYHTALQAGLQADYNLPSANYVFFDNESAIMNGVISYGNTSMVEAESGQDFSLKSKVVVSQAGTQSFDSGWFIRNQAAVSQGNTLLAVFYVKAEGGNGKISFFIENATTFAKEVFLTFPVDDTWRRFLIPFEAMNSYAADGLSMGFHLGFQAQTIEIGGFTLLNYDSRAEVSQLPDETNNEFYAGYEADAPWRTAAASRIDELRKFNLKIQTNDSNGMPLENAGVQVKMLQHEFAFGSAITANRIAGNNSQDNTYQSKILDLDGQGHGFNWVVFENDLKWPAWEQEWLVNKTELVRAVRWLRDQKINIRGHTLVWPGIDNMPPDIGPNINDLTFVKNRFNQHINTILNYPGIQGNIEEWDVVNEMSTNTDLETTFRNTTGYTTGREIIAEIFKKAREEDPNIGLWLNDYITLSLQQEAGSEQYDNLKLYVQELLDAGVDLEGIGFQSHISGFPNGIPAVLNTLDDFYTSFGLKAKITEFDTPSFVKESLGADYLRDYLTATFSHPSVDGFLFWNFWDGATWLNEGSNLFRGDWSMTPAGSTYVDLVFQEWWTNETITSNANGLAETRAFKGTYEISYRCGDAWVRDTLSLTEDSTLTIACDNFRTALNPAFELDMSVFPNPSTGFFVIRREDTQLMHIRVSNMQGQKMLQTSSSLTRLELDLAHVPKGMYVLEVDTDEGWYRDKLVRE